VFIGASGVLKRLVWPVSVIIIVVEGAKFVDDIEYCNICPLNLLLSNIGKCIFAKFRFPLQLMLGEYVPYSVSHTVCYRISQLHWPVEAPCSNTWYCASVHIIFGTTKAVISVIHCGFACTVKMPAYNKQLVL
jgi:hypothetical protein